jgi:hypothetical protein
MSCLLGTAGCALMAEGATNAGIDDITDAASQIAERARDIARTSGIMTESDYYPSGQLAASDR